MAPNTDKNTKCIRSGLLNSLYSLSSLIMSISIADRILLIKLHYNSGENVQQTIRHYATAKDIRERSNVPSYNAVKALVDKFEKHGTVHDLPRSGRTRDKSIPSRIEGAITELGNQCSSTDVALLAGVSQATAWKILRNDLQLFPYKIFVGQKLSAESKVMRKTFCEEFLRKFESDWDASMFILWSDEAKFPLIATPNRQNTRYWTETSSDVPIFEMPVNCPSITVFAAFNGQFLLPPYFFLENGKPTTVNGERYRLMITEFLIPELKKRKYFSKTIFMQDGAPSHTATETKQLLHKHFGDDKVISKGFPMAWPPYSPDLTPCDFWFWDLIKSSVYFFPPPESVMELQNRIESAFVSVTQEQLQAAQSSVKTRIEFCRNMNGSHLENVLT